MRARVAVYDKTGTNRAVGVDNPDGILPVIGLTFSEEIGGSGSCTYEALMSDVEDLSAWDAVILIELSSDVEPDVWVPGPAYVSRHQYSHKGGFRRFSFQCKSLLEAWAGETVFLPEYVVGTMPKKAGEQRGIGWMATAYDMTNDTKEPWVDCYEPGRSMRPDNWPSGSGAQWITVHGFTEKTEAKYFRTTLTISGSKKLLKFYISSDETATLWVAGEQLIQTTGGSEDGKKEFDKATLWMYPGTYAIGVNTESDKTKGGDGIDPIIVCAEHLNGDGDHVSWVLASNEDTWYACRRDNEPPNNIPPGPSPGEAILYLLQEAKDRHATGWDNVIPSFDVVTDTYSVEWEDIVEQLFNYGHHTYWNAFESWAESDQCDVWLTWTGDGPIVLNAAKRQGEARDIVFTTEHFWTCGTSGTEGHGTWVVTRAVDGWTYHGKSSGPRREYGLELGEAISRPIADKISKASLKDSWRWDGTASMNPPQPGWMPYIDFGLGDWMHVSYRAIEHDISITSISAKAGEGGLMFDLEYTEWPLETSLNP